MKPEKDAYGQEVLAFPLKKDSYEIVEKAKFLILALEPESIMRIDA